MVMALSSRTVAGLCEQRGTPVSLGLPASLQTDYAPTYEVGTIKRPPSLQAPRAQKVTHLPTQSF